MPNVESSADTFGSFSPIGPFFWMRLPIEEFHQALDHFFIQDGSIFRCKSSEEVASISQDREIALARALLTQFHEEHHYYQMLSSPLGVFDYKSYTYQIGSSHRYFLSALDRDSSLLNSLPVPLMSWAKKIQTHNEDAMMACGMWNMFEDFRKVFWSKYYYHDQDAAKSANFVLNIVNQGLWESFSHQDPHLRIDIRRPALHLPPKVAVQTNTILEAHARIMQGRMLSQLPVQNKVSKILESHMGNKEVDIILKHIYDMVGGHIPPSCVLILLDLALLSPVDPSYFDLWLRDYHWQDLHPGLRLNLIMDEARKITLPSENNFSDDYSSAYFECVNTISERLSWPNVTDLHKRGMEIRCLLEPNEEIEIAGKEGVAHWRLSSNLISIHNLLSEARLTVPGFVCRPGTANNFFDAVWPKELNRYSLMVAGGKLMWLGDKDELEEVIWYQCVKDAVTSSDFRGLEALCQLLLRLPNIDHPIEKADRLKQVAIHRCFGVEGYFEAA